MNRRIIFLGCTKFSEEILNFMIEKKLNVCGIFSIPKFFKISYSEEEVENINYSNLSNYAKKLNIPYYEINSIKGYRLNDFVLEVKQLSPDVIIAAGWYYMIPKIIRDIPKMGVWGLHASMLPKYAGGAPLVWAIINGETETGVTLFRMDSGVDDGDIILQKKLKIEKLDTINDLLVKSSEASKEIIHEALNQKNIEFITQDKKSIKIYPQRSEIDGEINLSWSKERIYNFIRAQSKPYPGAWLKVGNKKLIISDIKIQDIN